MTFHAIKDKGGLPSKSEIIGLYHSENPQNPFSSTRIIFNPLFFTFIWFTRLTENTSNCNTSSACLNPGLDQYWSFSHACICAKWCSCFHTGLAFQIPNKSIGIWVIGFLFFLWSIINHLSQRDRLYDWDLLMEQHFHSLSLPAFHWKTGSHHTAAAVMHSVWTSHLTSPLT